jgi:hypothetical protein
VRLILLAASLLMLAGCGYYHWSKEGADKAAFDRDSAECQQQAQGAQPWENCMKGKGWDYSGW